MTEVRLHPRVKQAMVECAERMVMNNCKKDRLKKRMEDSNSTIVVGGPWQPGDLLMVPPYVPTPESIARDAIHERIIAALATARFVEIPPPPGGWREP